MTDNIKGYYLINGSKILYKGLILSLIIYLDRKRKEKKTTAHDLR